jgi:hypothetical protein
VTRMDWDHETLLAPAGESPFYRALGEPGSVLSAAGKPAFSPQAAAEVIDLFALRGAAVTHGRIYLQTDEGPQALETPGLPLDLIRSPGAWGCRRTDGESWPAFVARSTDEARERVAGLLSSGLASGGACVDLEWVTEDELTYFGVPSAALIADRDLVTSGEWPRTVAAARIFDGIRVRWAGAVPGSFYSTGLPARIADLPVNTTNVSAHRSRIGELVERAPHVQMLRAELVNDHALPAIGELRQLRVLELLETRVTSLEAIANLEALECLTVHAAGMAPDMTSLARLPQLKILLLSGRALDRFDDIGSCGQLTGLHVAGGGPGAGVAIDSLAPVANLSRLRVLRLGLTPVRDHSLRALGGLRALRILDVAARRFPIEELAWLAATVTWLDHDIRSPFDTTTALGGQMRAACKKCGQKSRRATRGPRRQWLCPTCQPKKVAEYVARWELLLAAAPARKKS